MQAYYEYMIDVASYLGADPSAARAEMLEVLRFEMSLANFSLPREERRNASKLYNPMRVRDLSKFDPNTPWLDYINNILTPDIIQVRSTLRKLDAWVLCQTFLTSCNAVPLSGFLHTIYYSVNDSRFWSPAYKRKRS